MRHLQAARGAAITAPRRRVAWLALVVGVGGFAADWFTKQWALAGLSDGRSIEVIPGQLYLRLVRNPGAAFSMGESFTVVLTCLAIAAMVFLLGWMVPRVRHPGWGVAAGLLLAGVSGNLYDRLVREPGAFHGHVVDFLQVPWFAIFNVADVWISCAAVLVIWLTMITKVTLAGQRVEPRDEPTR